MQVNPAVGEAMGQHRAQFRFECRKVPARGLFFAVAITNR